jgi:hypothetical protein
MPSYSPPSDGGGATITEKGSAQTLNSTTFATTMSFTGDASAQYKVRWSIYFDGIDSNDNMKFQISSSNTSSYSLAGVIGGGVGPSQSAYGLATVTSGEMNFGAPNAADSDGMVELIANITMDSTGGTVNLQSALYGDNTDTDTVLLADCMQEITEL